MGNNRYLLPPKHGIVVDETLPMTGAMVDAQAYRHVAVRIYEDLANPAGSTGRTALVEPSSCVPGWSRHLRAQPRGGTRARGFRQRQDAPFKELVVSLTPLVRHFDPSSGRCLNDYADTVLKTNEMAVTAASLA